MEDSSDYAMDYEAQPAPRKRIDLDVYPTPGWVARALAEVAASHAPQARTLLDLGCGDGTLGQAVERILGSMAVTGVDLRHEALASCPAHWRTVQADLRWLPDLGRFDLAVANPPFSLMDQAIAACLGAASVAVVLGFASVLGGQRRYATLWSRRPPSEVIVSPVRPRYRGDTGGTDPRDTVLLVWSRRPGTTLRWMDPEYEKGGGVA